MRATLVPLCLALLLLVPPPAAGAAEGLVLEPPLEGRVVRGFDAPPSPYAAGHRGVDLAARAGSAVRAAAAGRVYFAGVVAGIGSVSVDHGNGWRTTYQSVIPSVVAGEVVAAGDRIGTLTAGHCPATDCLHWGLTDGERYLDPSAYAAQPVIRLLPAGSQPRLVPDLPAARVAPLGSRPVAGPVSSPSACGATRSPAW